MDKELNMYPDVSNQAFRLNKINQISDYFVAEIHEWELMRKMLSKYIAVFDYFDKSLITLSATSGGVSIAQFASVIGALIGIASASFSFTFSLTTRITKKLLKTTRNKNKEHKGIVMLARSKLNSIEENNI